MPQNEHLLSCYNVWNTNYVRWKTNPEAPANVQKNKPTHMKRLNAFYQDKTQNCARSQQKSSNIERHGT